MRGPLKRALELVLVPIAAAIVFLEQVLIKYLNVAMAAFARLQGGADFAEVAAAESEDPGSKARGGDLGTFGRGEMVPEFERAAFSAPVGRVVGPVRSPFGWHLIQVMERRTADVSNDRKRLEARRALRERKSDEAYQEWLRQLRDRSYVEYRLDDR